MSKRETPKVVGYLLLLVSLVLLIGYAAINIFLLSQRVQAPIPKGPGTISLKVADGRAYFVAGNTLYALRTSNGKQLWRFQKDGLGEPVIAGGLVYQVAPESIYALRGSDGKQLWQYRINGSSCFVLQFASVQGAVYVSASCTDGYKQPNQTMALRASDGEQLWDATKSLSE